MSYCTLQEAFNEASFDAPSKKKKSCQAQARASADAFDPFYPENGRGETAAWNRFISKPPPTVEGFQNVVSPEPPLTDKYKYQGRGADYKYYCENFGICADSAGTSMKKIERFQNPPSDDAPPVPPKCNIQSPQKYEIPISDEAKKMYDAAFKTAVMQENTNGLTYKPEPRKDDMEKVSGFYDEDLEQYLKTKDLSVSPKIPLTPIEPRELKADPYDPNASPFVKAMEMFEKEKGATAGPSNAVSETKKEEPQIKVVTVRPPIWDLLLFAFAGILVIFLCEQMFKLAIMIGMKKTVVMLEPFLSQIKV